MIDRPRSGRSGTSKAARAARPWVRPTTVDTSDAPEREVMFATRVYPCTSHVDPVQSRAICSIAEYAELAAPRLRAIADREPPPFIVPELLERWGIARD